MTQVLGKDDISQLRRATGIVIRFDTRDEPLGFRRIEGTIRPAVGSHEDERYFELPVNPVSVTSYGDERIEAGLWIISPAHFVPEWVTMLSLLRKGDELWPRFEADCHHRVKGDGVRRQTDSVFVDTFAMQVRRPTATGRYKMLEFNLGYQLTGKTDGARIRNLYTAERAASLR